MIPAGLQSRSTNWHNNHAAGQAHPGAAQSSGGNPTGNCRLLEAYRFGKME
jgi:hypothetical protein